MVNYICPIFRFAIQTFNGGYERPWKPTSSPGLFPHFFFREKPWGRGCLGTRSDTSTIKHKFDISKFEHDSEAFWSFFDIWFGFLCAQVSFGDWEIMES